MSNSTPGPWTFGYRPDARVTGNLYAVTDNLGFPSAFVPAWDAPGLGEIDAAEEAKANARLIAAAPDLLAALQALFEACEQRANTEGGDFGSSIGPAAALATAAIARATGGAA